jgi:hypothetical protein
MQLLMAELAKEEMLKPLEHGADYGVLSLYNYGDTAPKLMSLLEEEAKEENVKCY